MSTDKTEASNSGQADEPLALRLTDLLGPVAPRRDGETSNSGGCKCNECGEIFLGKPGDSICGACAAAYEEAMRQEERRAQWHAEMRRDAFGA